MKNGLSIGILSILVFSMLSAGTRSFGLGETTNVVYYSSPSVQWTQDYVATSGEYPVPDENAFWSNSSSAWRHPTWKRVERIDELYSSGADWIWPRSKVSHDEKKSGSVVFFTEEIFIPLGRTIVDATLEVTVDNAFYLYLVNQEDGFTGPVWNEQSAGEPPLIIDGFVEGYNPDDFWEVNENDMLVPKVGAIDIDSSVVRTLEPTEDDEVIIKDHLNPGLNWISIVAINAQPEPDSKQVSSNTAGLIYKLEITYETLGAIPDSIPDGVGFTVPLVEPPPIDFEYTFTDYEPTPIQAVFDPDIDDNSDPDMVLYKPMAVLVKVPSADLSITAEIDFDGQTYAETSRYCEGSYSILEFYPIIPTITGSRTITCRFINDPHADESIVVDVKETQPLGLSYYYLDHRKYGSLLESEFNLFVGKSTPFLNATYPVGNLTTDETYKGISGHGKGNKGDPFKGIREDAIEAAQKAQLALGSSARGVAIAPVGYFSYHGEAFGFDEAAAISFGPGLYGVVVEDGFWPAVAHEVGHTYGLNWVTAEEYISHPLYGKHVKNGIWVDLGEWTTGICFMGATPEETLEDSWVCLETYEELFAAMKASGDPPDLLLVNGIIYDGSVEFPRQWVRIGDGISDITDGVYRLICLNSDGDPIQVIKFDADYTVEYHPKMGAEILEKIPTSYSPFAFVAPYEHPETTTLIEIWDYTEPTSPVKLGSYDATTIMYFDRWLTDSSFVEQDELVLNFQTDSGDTNTYSLASTNPDTIMFNVVVEDIDYMSLVIELPEETGPGGFVSQAFNLVGAKPVHVYSQAVPDAVYDITDHAIIDTSTEGIIQVDYDFSQGKLAYITVHMEYALIGTTGWEEEYIQGIDEWPFMTTINDELGSPTAVENIPTILDARVNFAPVVDVGSDAVIDEGSTFTGSGSFTDPGADTWTATVDYGDGSGGHSLALNPDKTFSLSHLYADDGVYPVTVTVTDDDDGVGSDILQVTVNNVAPVVDAGPDMLATIGEELSFSGSYDDPGADEFTIEWDFGDGTPTVMGTLEPTHVYSDSGTYTVTLTVTDDDGGVGTDSLTVTVIHAYAYTTDSAFNDLTQLDIVWKKTSGEKDDYTFHNTNPGGLMYNLIVVDDGSFGLIIDLPEAHIPIDPDPFSAFNPQGQTYLHVYSDEDGFNDITSEIQWNPIFDGESLDQVILDIPSGRDVPLIYVRLHLDSALKGTTGWSGEQKRAYGEDLTFIASYIPDIGDPIDLMTDIHIGE